MQSQTLHFETIASEAGLSELEEGHFVEGMKQGAEDLPLTRETYLQLQFTLEKAALMALPRLHHPEENQERPFAYATPKPLTPLYDHEHLRYRITEFMFKRLLGISVMNDASFKTAVANRHGGAGEILFTVANCVRLGGDLFSTTMGEIQAPRMTMHLESDAGPVRVAFLAEQQPSETAGRLVFGDAATAMYREVVEMHAANTQLGRSSIYVFETITGKKH